MSLNLPSRRLLKSAASTLTTSSSSSSSSSAAANALLPTLQSLSLGSSSARAIHTTPSQQWLFSRKKKEEAEFRRPEDDPTQLFKKKKGGGGDTRMKLTERLAPRMEGPSIFGDETSDVRAAPRFETGATGAQPPKQRGHFTSFGASLAKKPMARAVDPDPRSRVRWERKMVIRQLTRGTDPFSREPRAERIARTEREYTSRSTQLPTSVKKLVHLAHQIQGKTVEDALVQMRYSKKKMAQEVGYQLREARDEATVSRGMGIGLAKVEDADKVPKTKDGVAFAIQTKDGSHLKIEDASRLYVAEAWVNRCHLRHRRLEMRARGRTNTLKSPSTTISIVLKEEKTRIREHQERVAKKLRQGPWVHLPDRPVTAQRPYYSW